MALIILSIFKFSKKYFWFGEEPVPAASLSQFLRGEKDAEYAHTVAAWSSVTGKGLLFFVKHADQKETPAGVLKLVCIKMAFGYEIRITNSIFRLMLQIFPRTEP
jgi:hypothetical protein